FYSDDDVHLNPFHLGRCTHWFQHFKQYRIAGENELGKTFMCLVWRGNPAGLAEVRGLAACFCARGAMAAEVDPTEDAPTDPWRPRWSPARMCTGRFSVSIAMPA
ncbi:MAG TPA: hypothetical protein DCP91_01985, partial [Eggerthellaceae bacterium]|nr:hypothetical protein [Eggerthellaceae bacterium]